MAEDVGLGITVRMLSLCARERAEYLSWHNKAFSCDVREHLSAPDMEESQNSTQIKKNMIYRVFRLRAKIDRFRPRHIVARELARRSASLPPAQGERQSD